MAKLWTLLRDATVSRSNSGDGDLTFVANGYTHSVLNGSGGWTRTEEIENSFVSYVQAMYKSSGVVFACMAARQRIFSQARFQWTQFKGAKPGPLFGSPELRLLERPWPNGSTNELLARMIQDTDLSGNAYVVREGSRLRRLRPDWVSIVLTAPPAEAVESDVAGYLYRPGGFMTGTEPGPGDTVYLPDEVCHWSPTPDPEAQYRGVSWLTPVAREVQSDRAATLHKQMFFENAATPNLAVSFKETVTNEQFDAFIADLNASHRGARNAYKTLYLSGGADVSVVGADLKQLDFKVVQGAGETRIANAAGVPAVIVGLSEGLQGSSLNAGNYNAARRNYAEGTLRDLWVGVCAALESIVDPPSDRANLWYDESGIPFLREDAKDIAEIQQLHASAIRQLVDGGGKWDAVVNYLISNDLSELLGEHSGLFSVQLQPPGAGQSLDPETARAVLAYLNRPALPSAEVSDGR